MNLKEFLVPLNPFQLKETLGKIGFSLKFEGDPKLNQSGKMCTFECSACLLQDGQELFRVISQKSSFLDASDLIKNKLATYEKKDLRTEKIYYFTLENDKLVFKFK